MTKKFVSEGADVLVSERNEATLQKVADEKCIVNIYP